jgi:uncharacterized protein (TIGR03435 family)
MMRALLADRFKLVARREEREVILALMLNRNDGKLGSNLTENKRCIQPVAAAAQTETPAAAQQAVCGPKTGGAGRLLLVGQTMQQFTSLLAAVLGRTVVDKTGLTARYDIDLSFAPQRQLRPGVEIPGPPADPNGLPCIPPCVSNSDSSSSSSATGRKSW